VERSIDVFLADDNLIVREGVRALIERNTDLRVVGVAADYDGVVAGCATTEPQVLVTDVRMPPSFRREGIDAAKEVRKRQPGTGVVVLSQYDDPEYAVSLLAEGSAGYGYLLKDRVAEGTQLADAIRSVATGGTALDPAVVEALVRPVLAPGGLTRPARSTPRAARRSSNCCAACTPGARPSSSSPTIRPWRRPRGGSSGCATAGSSSPCQGPRTPRTPRAPAAGAYPRTCYELQRPPVAAPGGRRAAAPGHRHRARGRRPGDLRPRGNRGSTPRSRPPSTNCASRPRSCASPGHGSSPAPTPSAAGWNATCTTARSSTSWRWR
jgi:DNA-binding NarL/FixJ family response regulator